MSRRRTKEEEWIDGLTGRPIREQTIEVRHAGERIVATERAAEDELVVEAEEEPGITTMALARWQPTRPRTEPPPPAHSAPPPPQGPPPDYFVPTYYRPPPTSPSQHTAVGMALGALVGGVAVALFGSQSNPTPNAAPVPSRRPGPPPRRPGPPPPRSPRYDRPPPVRPRAYPYPPLSPELARLFGGEDDDRND